MSQKWGCIPSQQQKRISNNVYQKQILSFWAEVSLALLPKSENTREWDKNMETDFSGLSFMPCAVTRMTEWISTHLLWICFKEKKNCKLLTQFLIISKKAMPKNTLHPSSVVRFTGKLWYLADSLKTLYLKCNEKHSTRNAWRSLCLYTDRFGSTVSVPKNWCSHIKWHCYVSLYTHMIHLNIFFAHLYLPLALKIKNACNMIFKIPCLDKMERTENSFKILHLQMIPGAIYC